MAQRVGPSTVQDSRHAPPASPGTSYCQGSTTSLSIRTHSATLLVTSIDDLASARPAIRTSQGPIGVPLRARSARSRSRPDWMHQSPVESTKRFIVARRASLRKVKLLQSRDLRDFEARPHGALRRLNSARNGRLFSGHCARHSSPCHRPELACGLPVCRQDRTARRRGLPPDSDRWRPGCVSDGPARHSLSLRDRFA